MARYLLIYCCLLLNAVLRAQPATDTLSLRWKKPGPIARVYPDHFGNVWMLTGANQLLKYSAAGDSISVYNAIARHGLLHQLSLNNPLQAVLFYRDFQTIVLLDRLLTPRATLPLYRAGLFQVKTACLSYDSQLWVYDQLENKLIKLDELGNRLLESSDFRQLLAAPFSPQYLSDENGNLCAYDADFGWIIFDYYGGIKKILAYPGWNLPDAFATGVSGWVHGQQARLLFSNLLLTQVPFRVPEGCIQFAAMNGTVYCLDSLGNLHVYR